MASLGLVNIGALATGILASPRLDAEAILVEHGPIAALGAGSRTGAEGADVVVDCRGTTVIPGLIDSHCHVVLGDYTPRQKTVDFLDSYVHGGITSVVSAGEGVHAPGRPHDSVAAKALAIAAAKCFANFRPNGMKVIAGSVVLEPGLTDDDFAEMARHGVRHAKYGFGGYAHPSPSCDAAARPGRWRACALRATRRRGPASCPWASSRACASSPRWATSRPPRRSRSPRGTTPGSSASRAGRAPSPSARPRISSSATRRPRRWRRTPSTRSRAATSPGSPAW